MSLYEVGGFKMDLNPEDKIISYRLKRGIIYERASVELMKVKLKKGHTFINVGANVGYFTLIASRCVGMEGGGFAFEPDVINYKYLVNNVALNNEHENIRLERFAVGDRCEMVYLYLNDKGNKGDHRTWKEKDSVREKVPVKMITLDDYFQDIDIDFIKMDIQGGEAKAIEGASRILSESPKIKMLMEFWPWGINQARDDSMKMIDTLVGYGFSIFDIGKGGSIVKTDVNELSTYPTRYVDHKNIWLEKEE